MKLHSLLLALVLILSPSLRVLAAEDLTVYFGTYTLLNGSKSKGIYVSKLDLKTGALAPARLAAESDNPSFLAVHPGGRFIYAANEVTKFDGADAGGVSAFAVDATTHALKLLNQQSSRGAAPCHLVVDKSGACVLVANYVGGSVAALPVKSDGSLAPASAFHQHTGSSVNPERQKEPHAHSINLDPAGRFAFAADLGADKVFIYRFDPVTGALITNEPAFFKAASGSGPRHFAFSPDTRHAYLINELLSTVNAFDYDAASGALTETQTITTLPATQEKNWTAHIEVHPGGRFVYGSNRGHNSIAIFERDVKTGRLTAAGHQSTGKVPRGFAVDPTGAFLVAANQEMDSVTVFRINAQTGALTPTGHTIEVPFPVCVKFLPLK